MILDFSLSVVSLVNFMSVVIIDFDVKSSHSLGNIYFNHVTKVCTQIPFLFEFLLTCCTRTYFLIQMTVVLAQFFYQRTVNCMFRLILNEL